MKYYVQIYLGISALLGLVACASDNGVTDEGRARLGLEVNIGTSATRATYQMTQAVINNPTAFAEGDAVGLSVSDAVGTVYTTVNTPYTLNGTVWQGTDIWLNDTPAMVSAYYPYSSTTDPTAISMDCTKNFDLLYVAYDEDNTVNNYRPKATIALKHAMSIFRLSIFSSIGAATISAVELSGEAIRKAGTLNTLTGKYTFSTTATDILRAEGLSVSVSQDINNPTTLDFYVLPTGTDNSYLIITLTIDDKNYTATVSNRPFSQGRIYEFPLELGDGRVLTVSSVMVKEWDVYRHNYDHNNNEYYDVEPDTDD